MVTLFGKVSIYSATKGASGVLVTQIRDARRLAARLAKQGIALKRPAEGGRRRSLYQTFRRLSRVETRRRRLVAWWILYW